MDSWLREIYVPRAWRVYLATGFDFREKNRVCFGSIRDLNFASYVLYNLPVLCHVSHTVSLGYLWYNVKLLGAFLSGETKTSQESVIFIFMMSHENRQ